MVADEGERLGRPGYKALRGWASAAPRRELNAEAIGRYLAGDAGPMSLGVGGLGGTSPERFSMSDVRHSEQLGRTEVTPARSPRSSRERSPTASSIYRFLLPGLAGPHRLVPLRSLADSELSGNALAVAAKRRKPA
jgi:hypothetical protein